MNSSAVLEKYGNLIHLSPTPFHAVTMSKELLLTSGFQELQDSGTWELSPGESYFVIRENSAIIAFKIPQNLSSTPAFRIVGSHTDSPCFKLKSNPTLAKEGYQQLNAEVYGSPLLNSWLDRDLKMSGLVVGMRNGELCDKICQLPWVARIPQLAIHLDRNLSKDGLKLNSQTEMTPVIGLGSQTHGEFKKTLADILKFDEILSWDLCFHDTQAPALGGMNSEFLLAPRLDNLAMFFTSVHSLIETQTSSSLIPIIAAFNHEEVGSTSHEGASGNFLESILERVSQSLSMERCSYLESLPRSLFMSADMAHAIHPNFPGRHDASHAPQINNGPVLKTNVNQRYATSASSAAKIKLIAKQANVDLQDFHSRNDMGCGSTIGPSSCSRLGIPGLDIGNPMLSMHSIREMCGVEDFEAMERLIQKFFEY